MTYEDYEFCRPYMVSGEYILWQGKPAKGSVFTSADVFLIPFSIFWCGFAFFWSFMASRSGAPFMAFFGLPFICVGIYMLFGRFIHTARMRKKTAYVITNKKIIRLRGNKIDMMDGKSLPAMHVVAHKNGSGTIRFGETTYYYSGGRRYRTTPVGDTETGVFSLENIPNVAQVQDIIANNME